MNLEKKKKSQAWVVGPTYVCDFGKIKLVSFRILNDKRVDKNCPLEV